MIRKIFDLNNLKECQEVEGITDLLFKDNLNIKDIEKSRGEFAGYFVKNNKVYLFRDRVGARNIYYRLIKNKLYVSTDIWWIAKQIKAKINDLYLSYEYFEYQVPFGAATVYEGIFKIMPSIIKSFYIDGVDEHRYWRLDFWGECGEEFNSGSLNMIIDDAVRFRRGILARLGKNYTSYLSGGIDSSCVTELLNPEESFSGIYKDEEYSEKSFIKALKRKTNYVDITEKVFKNFLKDISKIMPDPMCGLGVISQAMVACKAMSKGYNYAFTGEGGDEIFGGYIWNMVGSKLDEYLFLLNDNKYFIRYEKTLEKFNKELLPYFVAISLNRGAKRHIDNILDRWNYKLSPANNMMKIAIEVSLPAILTVDECVGKYTSVMPVSPLVDHKIIEYVASVDDKERNIIPKYFLRQSMQGCLPSKIINRYDKMGFPVPHEKWDWSEFGYDNMRRETWAELNIKMLKERLNEPGIS